MNQICLDTVILTLLFDEKCPQRILDLMESLKIGKLQAVVMKPVLIETYFHLCKSKGKDYASAKMVSLLDLYHLIMIELDLELIIKSGQIKCQNSDQLSYIDCMILSYCLKEKIALHTTERLSEKIPDSIRQKIKIIKYEWN